MITRILQVPFHCVTRQEALERLLSFLKENNNHTVVTPNPEMVMEAQKNPAFMKVLQEADLVVPDGIGIVIASRFKKEKLIERVAGCDLILALFEKIKLEEKRVYLLGGKPGVVQQAKLNMEKRYPGLQIVGLHHGYFKSEEEEKIIKDIQSSKPDILLVGLGFPRQEMWITTHKHKLPVKISVGVGGSLDVMSGTVKRAPRLFQQLGLEWLYRLMQQPSRAGRMLQLPLFLMKVIFQKH